VYRPRMRQAGVALVSVLLIVAILMAIASRLLASHNLVINQHQNTFEQNQALQYALGAETLAGQALYDDLTNSGKDSDHLGELWAQQVMPFELDEGGFLEAQLTDLNGCFNLNTVAGADGKAAIDRFKLLAQNLGLQPQLAEAWKDWIDDDVEVTGFGAEDSDYLIAQPPYRTPNQVVTDVSELYLLSNVDREQLITLLPHVCLLPTTDSLININTADAQTLAALDKTLTLSVAEPVVAVERDYKSVDEFIKSNEAFAPVAPLLSVKSEYFLLHAQAQVGSSSVTLQSLLHRDPDSGVVTVLSRDFGKLFRSNLTISTEEA
jgi:general secretion pathway protein K